MADKFPPTEYTEQAILNMGLDSIDIAPTSIRGGLEFVKGLGWIRIPIGGLHPYMQVAHNGSNQVEYRGLNTNIAAADAATDWIIFRYYYTGNLLTKRKMRVTSWTNKSSGW